MTLHEMCPIIQFQNMGDKRGNLVVIEGGETIPFNIRRIFYIFGTDSSTIRGQHANRESEFVLINVSGRSKVRITDGDEELVVELDKPWKGIYIPKMVWKDMFDFSTDAVLLVLANTHYDANEYIRNFEEYQRIMHQA